MNNLTVFNNAAFGDLRTIEKMEKSGLLRVM